MNEAFLQLGTEELQSLLVSHARADSAPSGARERALAGIAAGTLATSVASSAFGSSSSAAKVGAWLVAKWLLVGLGSGVLTLAAAQVISGPSPPSSPGTEHALSIAPTPMQASNRSAAQSAVGAQGATPTRVTASSIAQSPAASVIASPSAAPLIADLPSSADFQAFEQRLRASALPSKLDFAEAASAPPIKNRDPHLTREVSVLEEARKALTQNVATRALTLLNGYEQEFSSGALHMEAAELRLETVGKLGDFAHALQLSETFLKSYPASPLAERVRALADVYRRRVHKP